MNEGKRKQASDRLLFARAKDLMESHQVFLEPDLTLNKMADRLDYLKEQGGKGKIEYARYGFASRSSFYRLFQNFFNCSPHEYFNRKWAEEEEAG